MSAIACAGRSWSCCAFYMGLGDSEGYLVEIVPKAFLSLKLAEISELVNLQFTSLISFVKQFMIDPT